MLGEVVVKFKATASTAERDQSLDELSAHKAQSFRSGAEHWKFDTSKDVSDAVEWLQNNPAVEYAHPNYLIVPAFDPNDPIYPLQWHLKNTGQNIKDPNDPTDPNTFGTSDADMDIDLAWDITTGHSSNVIIAVIDYGIMVEHDDIEDNLWVNTAEDPNDNDDQDGNGCKDDINGCNFTDPNNYNGNVEDVNGHGHSVSGVIGARGNQIGVTGIMRQTQIMSLKTQGASNPTTAQLAAIDYAINMGVDIINASWSVLWPCSEPCAPSLREAIEEAGEHEILFVTAAHNQNVNVDSGDPNHARYPCNYDLDNIICVAATDLNDDRVGVSNWGEDSVDLGAPGNEIWTLKNYDPNFVFEEDPPPVKYQRVSQGLTSLATPMVSGIVGLMRSKSQDIPVELIRNQLLDPNSLDLLTDLDPNGSHPTVTGGRVNAYKTLLDHDPNSPTAITSLAGTGSGIGSFSIQWTSTGDDGSAGVATLYQVRTSASSITSANWVYADRYGNEPVPDPNGAGVTQSMTLTGLNPGERYYVGLRAFDEWGNGPLSNVITCRAKGGCTTSFCGQGQRFTFTGGYGSGCDGCCQYSWTWDASCQVPDECPSNACSCPI